MVFAQQVSLELNGNIANPGSSLGLWEKSQSEENVFFLSVYHYEYTAPKNWVFSNISMISVKKLH